MAGGKLRDLNPEESWAILKDLALYDNESWNDPKDFAKPVKAITLPQDVPSTSDLRLIELKNQVQRLMEAHLAPTQPTQVYKNTTPCEICNGPHDTQYCMENLKQAFVEYASSRTDEAGGKWYTFKPEQNNLCDSYNPSWKSHLNLRWRQPQNSQNNFSNPPNRFQPNGSIPNRPFNNRPQNFNNQSSIEGLVSEFMASQDARLSRFEADFKQQQSELTNKIDTVLKAIIDRIAGALPSDTVKNPKLGTHPVSSALDEPEIEHEEGNTEDTNSNPQPQPDPFTSIATEQVRKLNSMLESLGPNDGEGTTTERPAIEYFDTFPTRDELTYYKYVMSGPIPLIFLRNPIITEGCPSNLKIPCYINLNSPLNIMTLMMYNWIMRRKLNPKEDANGGVSNFTGRIKGMHVFIGNFTYVIDFMIVEDISSILDPRLTQVVLGRPFIEISDMTHDPPEGVVRFIKGTDEVAYKMPHKIEQYDSLSDLEKEHTKSVYLRNEEEKRSSVCDE
ncbi:hypothetical protein Tco_1443909 [Tanacetum coccineum]